MLFYKVTGRLLEETNQDNDNRIQRNKGLRYRPLAVEFNERMISEAFSFIYDINESEITCGIGAFQKNDIQAVADSFLKQCGLHISEIKITETTYATWRSLLSNAERYGFIEDDETILEKLELGSLEGYRRGFDFNEYMIGKTNDCESAYAKAREMMAEETLIPELDRICSGNKRMAFGHPVHYMIEADTPKIRKDLSEILVSALYDNDRIKSKRYCHARNISHHTPGAFYDLFYKSCSGGAVIVDCPGTGEKDEDEYADTIIEIVSKLCETMLEYQHQVLTIFCLPRECEKTKKLLFENLGSASVVEIREDLIDYNRACTYLKSICENRDIEPDEELTGSLEEDHQYLPEELRKAFDEWYNGKLKTVVFPQYQEIAGCRKEVVKNVAKGNAWDDLQEMIGLESAKKVIQKALNYYKLQRIYKEKGIKQDRPAMHMVFTGSPGTAKTTVARLFARIMKENSLLSKGHLVEVGRGDLVARYLGWTAKTVKEKFKEASGGVLFIDEAYSLVDDRSGSYGDEAINTIVQEMENHREDMVVIFAGYPDQMEQFLNKNPGLRSRIAFHVPFDDYDTKELCDIAKLIGKSKGIRLADGAMERLSDVFDTARKQPDFGNGRFVRNIIELSRMNQADRILSMDPDEVTESILTSIEAEDIEAPVISQTKRKKTIGFAV